MSILELIKRRLCCFINGHSYVRSHTGKYKDTTYAIYGYQCQHCLKTRPDKGDVE